MLLPARPTTPVLANGVSTVTFKINPCCEIHFNSMSDSTSLPFSYIYTHIYTHGGVQEEQRGEGGVECGSGARCLETRPGPPEASEPAGAFRRAPDPMEHDLQRGPTFLPAQGATGPRTMGIIEKGRRRQVRSHETGKLTVLTGARLTPDSPGGCWPRRHRLVPRRRGA